ncbi:MAG TPA: SpoIIE family protein phosphatase [Spirochaetales bacterium]|nr:SpoIIE family protein phosphatase [Spirochaetales bacterium]
MNKDKKQRFHLSIIPISQHTSSFAWIRFIVLAGIIFCMTYQSGTAALYYWEDPLQISKGNGAFPQAVLVKSGSSTRIVVVWQTYERTADGGTVWLSGSIYSAEETQYLERFAGPYSFKGTTVPVLFSLQSNNNGQAGLAVSSSVDTIQFFLLEKGTFAFKRISETILSEPAVLPRLSVRARGGWYIFLTKGQDANLSIVYTSSLDGVQWTNLSPLVYESAFNMNFLPTASSLDNRDFVVFQSLAALPGSERSSFQLYSKYSDDGGQTWSEAELITYFDDPVIKSRSAAFNFDNQRPVLFAYKNELWLVWERRQLVTGGTSQIYLMQLDREGKPKKATIERVSTGQGNCSDPRLFELENTLGVSWVDDRRGTPAVIMAIRDGLLWSETNLSLKTRQSALFGRTLYQNGGIYSFWQTAEEPYRIIGLLPDTSVDSPRIRPLNFTSGTRTNNSNPLIEWSVPQDSSGIMGFSWSWSRDPRVEPPETVMELSNVTKKQLVADGDGEWYFKLRTLDYAGNWSTPALVTFVRDTTPPSSPIINAPEFDSEYFLLSNTFSLTWQAPNDDEIVGYTWTLQYVGSLDRLPVRKRQEKPEKADVSMQYAFEPITEYEKNIIKKYENIKPPSQRKTVSPLASFTNIDDGYYVFAVSAIDSVGNISEPARMIIRADRFIPYTIVTNVLVNQEFFGDINASIIGRVFLEDGIISRIVLDLDGKEPYDKVFEQKDYQILSDGVIRNIKVNDTDPGVYRIGVYHTGRGWFFTGPIFKIDVTGTVKIGDYSISWKPSWTFVKPPHRQINLSFIFIVLTAMVALLGVTGSVVRLKNLTVERYVLLEEVTNIMKGKAEHIAETKKRELRAKGGGLFIQFAMTIALLVLFVVILVSLPLGYQLLNAQGESLAQGLEQRSRVLLESVAQGAKTYLPAKNILELSLLPAQKAAIKEADYITITSVNPQNIGNEIFWASNDPDIKEKAKGEDPGVSIYSDSLSSRLEEIRNWVNTQAETRVGDLAKTVQSISLEGRALATKLDDPKSQQRLQELSAALRDIEKTLNERLSAIAEEAVTAEPAFNIKALNPLNLNTIPAHYVFLKPIIYRQEGSDEYFRGFVRLSVSTELIVQELLRVRALLIQNTLIIAALALIIGIIGALALARIIARPILKLAEGIEVIRTTEDKKKLENFVIHVKAKNEIGVLTETINNMTVSLVDAAKEAELLTVGKEVQKMFLPLATKPTGEKLSIFAHESNNLSVYGYYEGAKGVSGDYFDFKTLEPPYYAFIKCDVAGKGVPAALIMVGVATIFSTEFANWSFKKSGINLAAITYKINDFIEKKGFKGRFAAFIMGLYDSSRGLLHLCHAGDKLVHFYKWKQKQFVTQELPSSPTAGTFDNTTVEATAPFRVVSLPLEPGDVLLLYTDGFEESSRARRKLDFTPLTEAVKDPRTGKVHEEYLKEQFGEERIKAITEAIYTRSHYVLKRQDDPAGPDEQCTFDFSTCDGSLHDLVIGLAAVEKVFRMIPDPNATDTDTVVVDSLIDDFLVKHFKEYSKYCGDKRPYPDEHITEYRLYGHLKEDEQYDDLTMLSIQRKL